MDSVMKRLRAPVGVALLFGGCANPPLVLDEERSPLSVEGSLTALSDFTWSEPVNLGPEINKASIDQGPSVSKDELSLYFVSQRPEGFGLNDIYVSTREHKHDPWGPGVNLGSEIDGSGFINTPGTESTPALSTDGDLLYFASNGHPGSMGLDIWVSARLDKHDPLSWSAPVKLVGGVNSAANDLGPAPLYDKKTKTLILYFYSNRPGGSGCRDLYSSTRGEDGVFGPAVPVVELNTAGEDEQPAIRRDGLEIFFVSNRPAVGPPCLPPGTAGGEIWVSTRASTSDPWGAPVNLGSPVNTPRIEGRPALSFDARSLYFFSDGHGGEGSTDLFVSTRIKPSDPEDENGQGDD